jgi:hypothetical protein
MCAVITVYMVMLLRDLVSVCWLVGDHLLLRDFGPCPIILTMCMLLQMFPW